MSIGRFLISSDVRLFLANQVDDHVQIDPNVQNNVQNNAQNLDDLLVDVDESDLPTFDAMLPISPVTFHTMLILAGDFGGFWRVPFQYREDGSRKRLDSAFLHSSPVLSQRDIDGIFFDQLYQKWDDDDRFQRTALTLAFMKRAMFLEIEKMFTRHPDLFASSPNHDSHRTWVRSILLTFHRIGYIIPPIGFRLFHAILDQLSAENVRWTDMSSNQVPEHVFDSMIYTATDCARKSTRTNVWKKNWMRVYTILAEKIQLWQLPDDDFFQHSSMDVIKSGNTKDLYDWLQRQIKRNAFAELRRLKHAKAENNDFSKLPEETLDRIADWTLFPRRTFRESE